MAKKEDISSNNFQSTEEFLAYKKIDEILWFDWDPIGVNDIDDARDEYEGYVPEIFNLRKACAGREEIAIYLINIEKERMGLNGNLANCLNVAGKIVSVENLTTK